MRIKRIYDVLKDGNNERRKGEREREKFQQRKEEFFSLPKATKKWVKWKRKVLSKCDSKRMSKKERKRKESFLTLNL